MPTLILTPRQTEDAQVLWRAALALGWDVERLTSWRAPAHLRAAVEPVLYVEALFGPSIAEQLGVSLLDPAPEWLPGVAERYTRRHISACTLAVARRLTTPAFVKPPNDKSFPAQVYLGAQLPPDFDDDMTVLVSEIVSWQVEFRCFILERTLRTFSVYVRDGVLQAPLDSQHSADEERGLRDFLGALLADPAVDLPRAVVLDVGIIPGRGWAVVEANAAWGSGLYGADPGEALQVIRHATIRR